MKVQPPSIGRLLLIVLGVVTAASRVAGGEAEDHFEQQIRPVLTERCHRCHNAEKHKGGLRLDSREALLRGGDSGAVVVTGKPDDSLLLQALRHQDGLAMPPDGRLTEPQIAAFAAWIQQGLAWPGSTKPVEPAPVAAGITPMTPNAGELGSALQVWLRTDALTLGDGEAVHVWPDRSGHARDFSATKGVRQDGVGLPARFVRESTLFRRPAVRFTTSTGLAASPDRPIDVRGDAALTILLVMNLQPHAAQPPYDGVLGIGNPAHAGDPGRPLAALVQINQREDHALHFAGGWNHDASLGAGSFKPHYHKPVLLTITKQPGPMRATTRIYLNGEPATPRGGEPPEGRDGVPDIQHRSDIGAYLGKALGWCGSIQGDVGEVLVYNRVLSDQERAGVECHLSEKFGLLPRPENLAAPATFTPEEKSYWAWQPVRDEAPPAVKNEGAVATPVDRFILKKLEERGLSLAPQAEKRMLLRRIAFDLTGLPPTPEDSLAYLSDDTPGAFERAVDRLLESPHHGEHWARHWLDVVRYAETTANDANAVMPFAWRYRNYVVDAFNRDLPYDQFLIEQLAGDLLSPTDSVEINTRRIIATGYLMVGPKALAETDKEQSRLDIVDDQIDVTGRAMLGLTLACARCHDHKFDAIRTTDYYAVAGIFRSTEPFQNENRNATMWWEFPVPQGQGKEPITVMAPREAQPRNLRVHLRGNRFTLGATVPRGVLQVVQRTNGEASPAVDPRQLSSGRLELAQWIASSRNPLAARVMVNRVWQHHFGTGIVATSDNFGVRGERPTHPELLDWLAARFIESGWSVKSLHRLIVLSNAYRQSSDVSGMAREADPEGRWLSFFPRRRLSAEELRDAMLAVSGRLDRVPGSDESGAFLLSKAEDINAQIRPNRVAADDPLYTEFAKRSVYLPIVRNMLPDVLALFDAADPNSVTAVRNETTVASQSLFLLNSPFVRTQARGLAEQLLGDASRTPEQNADLASQLALGRAASADEQKQAREFIDAWLQSPASASVPVEGRRLAAWQSYCQAILCSNEFSYVD